ncbi:MAG: hypothetical protein ACRENZ_07800, partial [Thermodesulfobacteriota bacterium]
MLLIPAAIIRSFSRAPSLLSLALPGTGAFLNQRSPATVVTRLFGAAFKGTLTPSIAMAVISLCSNPVTASTVPMLPGV